MENFAPIDEVLAELDKILEECREKESALGLFCFVYRRTTAEIKKAILNNQFEDAERMVAFDVCFARYYIEAYYQYQSGETCTTCWSTAFDQAENTNLGTMQHILLGMNAHINFDLGIAAARIMEGGDISKLEHDFMKVNRILAGLVDEMQLRIMGFSPLLKWFDLLGGRLDEGFINFSMSRAREQAWNFACLLARASEEQKQLLVREMDRKFSGMALDLIWPRELLFKWLLKLTLLFEEKKMKLILEKLRDSTDS